MFSAGVLNRNYSKKGLGFSSLHSGELKRDSFAKALRKVKDKKEVKNYNKVLNQNKFKDRHEESLSSFQPIHTVEHDHIIDEPQISKIQNLSSERENSMEILNTDLQLINTNIANNANNTNNVQTPILTIQNNDKVYKDNNAYQIAAKLRKNKLKRMKSLGCKTRHIFGDEKNVNLITRTKELEFLIEKYRFNTLLQCIVCLISIITVFLDYEISFWNNTEDGNRLWQNNYPVDSAYVTKYNFCNYFVLYVSFISTCLLWLLIIYNYCINCEIFQNRKNIDYGSWILRRSNLIKLAFNLIAFLPHPNPLFKDYKYSYYFANKDIHIYYSVNSILGLFTLHRLWFFIKNNLVTSIHFSARQGRICNINNFDPNLHFTLKANMLKYPLSMVVILILTVIIYCSFGLRMFEREIDTLTDKNFASFFNCIWCLIITMTTVGYGDYFPSTIFGRMIIVVACLWGCFLISMFILSITNLLNFEEQERTIYLLLQRISLAEDKEEMAAKFITNYMKAVSIIKHNDGDKSKINQNNLLIEKMYLKNIQDDINFTYPPYSDYDNILEELNYIENTVEDLNKQLTLIN